jgi:hypothetical protein
MKRRSFFIMKLLPFAQAFDSARESAPNATKSERIQAIMYLSYAISILEGKGSNISSSKGKVVPIARAYELKGLSMTPEKMREFR